MPRPSFDPETLEPRDWALIREALKTQRFFQNRRLKEAQEKQEYAHKYGRQNDVAGYGNYIKAAHGSIARNQKLLDLIPEVTALEWECNQWE